VTVERPDTQYTWSGEFSIAYQTVGEGGPADLVYLPYWMSSVEGNWRIPPLARFMQDLAGFCRLVLMDRRGVGCSDRLTPGQAATLEEEVDDLLAVTEAAYCGQRTFLFGGQETGFALMLAAATHPDRFAGLILFSAAPSYRQFDDFPWAWSPDQVAAQVAAHRRATSVTALAEAYVRRGLSSHTGDRALVREVASLMAETEGRGAAQGDFQRFFDTDLRDLLPTIAIPTLLLHRTDDPAESIESGRYLAAHIAGAQLVELPGADVQPWAGDSGRVIEEIRAFVTGVRGETEPVRRLTTVLFTDIVDSTGLAAAMGDAEWGRTLAGHHEVVRTALERFKGEEVDTTGDGFLATFDGPARAVECARAITENVRDLGLEIRSGCHTGEIELAGPDLHGMAVHIGARVAALAGPSETLVSSTVRDLVAGSGLTFEDAGEHELKGVPDRWHLYRVVNERA